ncbi:MAG: pyridoxamine 5'-phosphate oxidase family protein [Flavobacteriaceae bacterium]|jgi:hypothetical protein
MTLETLFNLAKDHWIRAKNDKKHPFRYFTLATVNAEGLPKTRMVVLRDFDVQHFTFTLYTDARSNKVKDLQHQKNVQLFFYHPKKQMQLIVEAELVQQDAPKALFLKLPPSAQKDYTTSLAPGSLLEPEIELLYESHQNYFMRLVFEAKTIEILQLSRPQHQRARFIAGSQGWKKDFLVP